MTDPFDDLEHELSAAEERMRTGAARAAQRRGRRWPSRPLLAAALALTITAGAAAAVALRDEPSAGLHGTLQGDPGPGAADAYEIGVTPALQAGMSAWCVDVRLSSQGSPLTQGGACASSPTGAPIIAGGIQSVSSDHALFFVVTDSTVAAVRLIDGRQILTRTDEALPDGWRAASALVPTKGFRTPDAYLAFTALDGAGATISGAAHSLRELYPQTLPPASAASSRAASDRCAILNNRRSDGVQLGAQRSAPRTSSAKRHGSSFYSCASATVRFAGQTLHAGLLVRSGAKGPAPELPGQRASTATTVQTRALTARRISDAWLVLTGANPALRVRALAALSARL